jgi:hypothetical protein
VRFDTIRLAVYYDQPRTIEYLSGISRDVFNLAGTGNVERLRHVLSAVPQLAKGDALANDAALFYRTMNNARWRLWRCFLPAPPTQRSGTTRV